MLPFFYVLFIKYKYLLLEHRNMYKFLLILIFFLFTSFGLSTEPKKINTPNLNTELSDQEFIYRTLGTYTLQMQDGSLVSVEAYILRRANNSGIYTQYKYEYVLTAVSRSVHNGQLTKTWLYNTRVYLDKSELTLSQYPNGVTIYVNTSPTPIYNWYTSEENIGQFFFKWAASAYEPRIR